MKLGFLFLPVILSSLSYSQNVYTGVLRDAESKEFIEFANVGLPGKGVGTVSNQNGEFTLTIPDSLLNKEVKVSMIGYQPKTISLSSLREKTVLYLTPQNFDLKEVTVAVKKYKTKVLGHETKTRFFNAGFTRNNLGAEMAVPLHIKNKHTQLLKLMFNITRNTLNAAPVFRCNVYSVDKDGYPKENILKQNIVISPQEKEGFMEIDLRPFNIFVNEDACISLEWIKDLGDARGLYFSTKMVGNVTYFRMASQDKWEKTNVVGIGLHVEVGY